MNRALGMLGALVSLIGLVGSSPALAAPNPKKDIKIGIFLYKPGCDAGDYFFAVKNTSILYEYQIVRRGTAALAGGPATCCGGQSCSRTWPGTEEVLLVAGSGENCEHGPPEFPGFPTCANCSGCDCPYAIGDPQYCQSYCNCGSLNPCACCNCDNDTCGSEAWCSTIVDPSVTVTKYREVNTSTWSSYDPPIVLCRGQGFEPVIGQDLCIAKSMCVAPFSLGGCSGI